MDNKEVAALLAMNKANFPYAYRDMSKIEKTALLDSWTMQFADYPAELIQGAFMEALKVCKHPVTIADIFERLNKIRQATEKTTDMLWQEFLFAANKAAYLADRFYYNGPSKKGIYRTQGEECRKEAEELFLALDLKIKAYVGGMKRLIEFGNMESAHLEQIIYPAFRRSMESMSNRQEVLDTTSPGMLTMASGQSRLETKLLSVLAGKWEGSKND